MRGWIALAAACTVAIVQAGPLPKPPRGRFMPVETVAARAWDCWIDPAEGGGIRCIADRDQALPLPAEYTDDDEAAETLLELVHGYLHRGNPIRASELVREASHLLRREDLWTIRLSAPPLDASWQEERPARLVRALLCRGGAGCSVGFHR